MAEPQRLNILVFLVDQLPIRHTGFGGSAVARTPTLDRLAETGVVFERAYVANPICQPARASLFTGLMPSVHGTWTNGISLDPRFVTFPRALRARGWETAAVGKLHFQNMGFGWGDDGFPDMDALQRELGLTDRFAGIVTDRGLPDGWDHWEDMYAHRRERIDLPPDYYGFDRVDLVTGHSDWASGQYYQWARARGLELDDVRGWARAGERYEGWDQVYRSAVPEELYPTSYVTERALARLDDLAATSNPWVLYCSYPDPHHPFTPPERYWRMFEADDMPLPETFADPHERSIELVRRAATRRGTWDDGVSTWAPTEEQYRHALAAELGMLAMIDDSMAAVLAEVERRGLADRTAVVFASDHGDLGGEHGLLLKGIAHYDASIRVPLVVCAPGARPRRVDSVVSQIDIAPTLLELAGCPPFRGMQGRSLAPIVFGSRDAVRDAALIEEDGLYTPPGLSEPPRIRTVVTADRRLTVHRGTGETELYALDADPLEQENLAQRDTRLERETRAVLADTLIDHADLTATPSAWT